MIADTPVRHVITTCVGDLLSFPKGAVMNFVLRHVKKAIPEYQLPGAVGFRQALELGEARALPEVDILVNSLGIFGSRPALEIADDEWRRYFETNVLAAVRLTRAYLPGMMTRGWGRVQYIASDSAVVIPADAATAETMRRLVPPTGAR